MIKIIPIYLFIILFIIGVTLFVTSYKFFSLSLKKLFVYSGFTFLISSFLFMLFYLNKTNLLAFISLFALFILLQYILLDDTSFKINIMLLKSYYIFVLAFTTIFSLYEIIENINIYTLVETSPQFLLLFVISTLIYLLLELCFFKIITIDKFNFVFSSINGVGIISIFILLISKSYSFFYILNFSRHSQLISLLFLVSSIIEICFLYFVLIGINKAYDLSIYKYNNKILNMQYNIQSNTLKELSKHESNIRMINHDIKNHKIVLHNLIKSNKYDSALEYLESFTNILESTSQRLYTNNKTLNALLVNKEEVSLSNNINFNCDIKVPEDLDISDFDLCVLVGNLVDNSIEACNKLTNDEEKYINIKSKLINNNFVFEVKNSYNGNVKMKQRTILTSKKDSINHGLGLNNVNSIVSKYNGLFTPTFNSNEFTSLIIIPII